MLENQVDYLGINESWFLIFKLHDSYFVVISLTGVSCFFLSCFSVLRPTPVVSSLLYLIILMFYLV